MDKHLALIKRLMNLNYGSTVVGGIPGLAVLAKGLGVSQYARQAAEEGGWWISFYWSGQVDWLLVAAGLSAVGFSFAFGREKAVA